MQIMFRTRRTSGFLFMTQSFSTLERIILEVQLHLLSRVGSWWKYGGTIVDDFLHISNRELTEGTSGFLEELYFL